MESLGSDTHESIQSAPQTEASIRTRGLNLWYGDFQALIDVDLEIKPGIVTALIGPSGCGKTTLLRCFNRINERYGNVTTTGEITILGKNIYDADVSLSQLRKTRGHGLPAAQPAADFDLRERAVRHPFAHAARGPPAPANSTRWSSRPCATCSSGTKSRTGSRTTATRLTLEQQQKLCIARLLPLKPRVILMDEPCSALDAEGIERIETLIQELRETYTILIVTHNMAQARRASDECIFMLLGRIIEHDKTLKVFLNPREKETEMYVTGRYG